MNQNNTEISGLDSQYSTTRCVTRTPPVIVNNPEDKFESLLFLPENSERKAEGGLRTQGYFKHTQTDKPLISVITVVFNGAEYLEQTINSVIGQTYDNVEYIIIDGGSTDGTLDIIKKHEGQIDYWVSERDKGISDAFNKGISLCSGEIVGIINADDWYEKMAFSSIEKYIGKADVLYGDMNLLDDVGKKITPKVDHNNLKKNMTICHPSCFVKSRVYKKRFIYETGFNYAMDYELLLKLYLGGGKFFYIGKVISNMRSLGVSDNMWINALKEVRKAKKVNGVSFVNYQVYFYFYFLKQSVRRFFQSIGLGWVVNVYRQLIVS